VAVGGVVLVVLDLLVRIEVGVVVVRQLVGIGVLWRRTAVVQRHGRKRVLGGLLRGRLLALLLLLALRGGGRGRVGAPVGRH
jgi:hypothetical protein